MILLILLKMYARTAPAQLSNIRMTINCCIMRILRSNVIKTRNYSVVDDCEGGSEKSATNGYA